MFEDVFKLNELRIVAVTDKDNLILTNPREY